MKKKLIRNPRSDHDLCKKGNKSPNRKGKQKSKQKKGNKSPSRKGEIKVKKKKYGKG